MRKVRRLAVCLAALGLIAWEEPKTAAPEVTKDAAAAEAKRQQVYLVRARAREQARADSIAFRIEAANQDLCADRRPELAITLTDAASFPVAIRAAAIEALQLGDGVTVSEVVPQGPAAAAGLKPGDVVLSLNGEPAPDGRNASEKLTKRLRAVIGQSTALVTLVVRRAGAPLTIVVAPVMTCGYEVFVDDSPEVNAFADGRSIHVNRPLLKLAQSDDELALVIAHEVAHNGQHHIQAQQHNGRIVGLGGLLIDGIAAVNGVNTGGAFTKAGVEYGMAHAAPAFEAEADYVGMYYLARAGFQTDGVEEFWRKMAVEEPESIFIKTDHPTSAARFVAIAATSREIEAKRAAGEPLTPNEKAN